MRAREHPAWLCGLDKTLPSKRHLHCSPHKPPGVLDPCCFCAGGIKVCDPARADAPEGDRFGGIAFAARKAVAPSESRRGSKTAAIDRCLRGRQIIPSSSGRIRVALALAGFIHCLDLPAVVIFGQHRVLLGLAGRRETGGRRERGGRLLGQGWGRGGKKSSSSLGGLKWGTPQPSGSPARSPPSPTALLSTAKTRHSDGAGQPRHHSLPSAWEMAPSKPSGPEKLEGFWREGLAAQLPASPLRRPQSGSLPAATRSAGGLQQGRADPARCQCHPRPCLQTPTCLSSIQMGQKKLGSLRKASL